jgi:hypothetical protein
VPVFGAGVYTIWDKRRPLHLRGHVWTRDYRVADLVRDRVAVQRKPAGGRAAFRSLDGYSQPVRATLPPAYEAKPAEAKEAHCPRGGLRHRASRRGHRAALQVVILGPADVAGEGGGVAHPFRPDGEEREIPLLRRGRADIEQQAVRADRVGLVEVKVVRAIVGAEPNRPTLVAGGRCRDQHQRSIVQTEDAERPRAADSLPAGDVERQFPGIGVAVEAAGDRQVLDRRIGDPRRSKRNQRRRG